MIVEMLNWENIPIMAKQPKLPSFKKMGPVGQKNFTQATSRSRSTTIPAAPLNQGPPPLMRKRTVVVNQKKYQALPGHIGGGRR